METLEKCRFLSECIDGSKEPSHGCLLRGTDVLEYQNLEDYLINRPPWHPLKGTPKNLDSNCQSVELPFCSSMSSFEAERFGAQYLALYQCANGVNGGALVESISTCAVLVVGAGGIGSPLLMYLAAAGIGVMGIMDGDVVDLSNLHRQVIHDEKNEGINKARSACERLLKINSKGRYIAYERFFGEKEAKEILPLYDIVVDATDNPQTRYLLNDACVLYSRPLIIASSIGSQGQIMVFNRGREAQKDLDGTQEYETPCFRCICPLEGNPHIKVGRGSCNFSGVIGPVPGLFGCLQAIEVLKLASGVSNASLGGGRMLFYDAFDPARPFRCVILRRNPSCAVCGAEAKPVKLKMLDTYECGVNFTMDDLTMSLEDFWRLYMDEVSNGLPVSLHLSFMEGRIVKTPDGTPFSVCLVDSRPQSHFAYFHLPGSVNWPLEEMLDDLDSFRTKGTLYSHIPTQVINEVPQAKSLKLAIMDKLLGTNDGNILLLFICRRGNASREAAQALCKIMEEQKALDDTDECIIHCYSVSGGCQGIKIKLGLNLPMT